MTDLDTFWISWCGNLKLLFLHSAFETKRNMGKIKYFLPKHIFNKSLTLDDVSSQRCEDYFFTTLYFEYRNEFEAEMKPNKVWNRAFDHFLPFIILQYSMDYWATFAPILFLWLRIESLLMKRLIHVEQKYI